MSNEEPIRPYSHFLHLHELVQTIAGPDWLLTKQHSEEGKGKGEPHLMPIWLLTVCLKCLCVRVCFDVCVCVGGMSCLSCPLKFKGQWRWSFNHISRQPHWTVHTEREIERGGGGHGDCTTKRTNRFRLTWASFLLLYPFLPHGGTQIHDLRALYTFGPLQSTMVFTPSP